MDARQRYITNAVACGLTIEAVATAARIVAVGTRNRDLWLLAGMWSKAAGLWILCAGLAAAGGPLPGGGEWSE